ncbi:MAG TPA: hypothetical protein PK609_01230 [Candidatus Paceibacterota bacterium]|nr:hypothetical protein [Candidatus Paceibacterota bacterium]
MATDRILGHIERLREKPDHVRHQIAMGTALGLTSLVAVGWVVALATSGTLALNQAPEEAPQPTETSFSSLVGAAGAAFNSTSTDASLRVMDERTSSTLDAQQPANNTNKTVIPF